MKVALFGHGHMGRQHARHLAALADVVVIDPPLGMAGDPAGIDAAVVAVPTTLHAEVALPLLERGIPCLLEKPVAASVEDARALAAFPHAWVGHIERFNPAIAPLRGVALRFVQAERVARWTPRGTDVDVVLDLMIHDLDLFLWLAREDVTEVRANGASLATRGLDLAHARVETASGIAATFTASRLARQPSRRFRAFGAGRYWSLDLHARQAARVGWAEGIHEEPVPVAEVDALGAQLRAFLDVARGRPTDTPPATAAEGLRALELALRIRGAARS